MVEKIVSKMEQYFFQTSIENKCIDHHISLPKLGGCRVNVWIDDQNDVNENVVLRFSCKSKTQNVIDDLVLGEIGEKLLMHNQKSLEAVSYTHLTLPTICSV